MVSSAIPIITFRYYPYKQRSRPFGSASKELICAENFDLTADIYYNDGYLCLKGFPFVFRGNDDVTFSQCFDVLIDTGTYGISLAMIGNPDNYNKRT